MSPYVDDPRDMLDQYETLRREATETTPGGPRGHGLALFLTRGMPGWLAALTALAPALRLSRARLAPPPPRDLRLRRSSGQQTRRADSPPRAAAR